MNDTAFRLFQKPEAKERQNFGNKKLMTSGGYRMIFEGYTELVY
jgi:hypothetical protein